MMGEPGRYRKRKRPLYVLGAGLLVVVPAAALLAARTIWFLCPRFFCLLVVVPTAAFLAAAMRRVRDDANRGTQDAAVVEATLENEDGLPAGTEAWVRGRVGQR